MNASHLGSMLLKLLALATKIAGGCILLSVALCLLITVVGLKLTIDYHERVLVRYTPVTAAALCAHFGWNDEPFCSQPELQNARVLNDLLDAKFPDPSYYTDLEPYIAALPARSRDCYPQPAQLAPVNCPPPSQCQPITGRYTCVVELPGGAGDLYAEFSVGTGRIAYLSVTEYPESARQAVPSFVSR